MKKSILFSEHLFQYSHRTCNKNLLLVSEEALYARYDARVNNINDYLHKSEIFSETSYCSNINIGAGTCKAPVAVCISLNRQCT